MDERRNPSSLQLIALLAGVFLVLLVTAVGSTHPAGATPKKGDSGQGRPQGTQGRLSENQRQQAAKEAELAAAKKSDLELEASLVELNGQLSETRARLAEATERSVAADKAVADVQASIEVTHREIAKYEGQVNSRAVDIYKNPDRGAVDAILGSESLADAGRRIGLVNRIIEADRGEMKRFAALKRDLAEDEENLVVLQVAARSAKEAEEAEGIRLETLAAKQEATKRANAARIASLQAEVDALAEEESNIRRILSSSPGVTPPTGSVNVRGNGKFGWPVGGVVTSEFGNRCIEGSCRMHSGIDISAPLGTPVGAAGAGTVVSAGGQGAYGNTVIIDHGGGFATLYAHMSALSVRAGQQVGRGTAVGAVGSTGHSTGPHLHFEVRLNGAPQNPRAYL